MTLNLKSGFTALIIPSAFMAIIATLATFPMGLSVQNGRIVSSFLGVGIALGIIYLVLKKEQSTLREYQLFYDQGTSKRFILGILLSIALGGGMILAHFIYSDLQMTTSYQNLNKFLLMSLLLIPLAYMEELVFRSVVLTKLTRTYNIWTAQIIVAILFALYHVLGAQGQSLASAFMGPGIWALIFGVLALKSNGIALPTGFHFGLNLMLAAIGEKSWIQGIWVIDFKESPSAEVLQAHETFGFVIHSLLLVLGITATFYLSKQMSNAKNRF